MPENDATRVDLGEDLLQEPASVESTRPKTESLNRFDAKFDGPLDSEKVSDLLNSAKIFLSEGFPGDAKKILHRILIAHPGNAAASQMLVTVYDVELKQIFRESDDPHTFSRKRVDSEVRIDSKELMRKLDEDLHLGVSELPTLFDSPETFQQYCTKLEADMSSANASPMDWIDVGIAFFEMDLYAVSERLFLGAIHRLNPESAKEKQTLLSATCLLALALILSGRYFDAISQVQPLLRDNELKREDKVELFYLMGRIHEAMKKNELAINYYRQVHEIDPRYRDVELRLKLVV